MTTTNLPATRCGFGTHAVTPSYTQVPSLFLNWRLPLFEARRQASLLAGDTERAAMLGRIINAYIEELDVRDGVLVQTGLSAADLEQSWWGLRSSAPH